MGQIPSFGGLSPSRSLQPPEVFTPLDLRGSSPTRSRRTCGETWASLPRAGRRSVLKMHVFFVREMMGYDGIWWDWKSWNKLKIIYYDGIWMDMMGSLAVPKHPKYQAHRKQIDPSFEQYVTMYWLNHLLKKTLTVDGGFSCRWHIFKGPGHCLSAAKM